ncbi:MAG TPA: sigma-70 family RNA polymerase sigma factor [Acidimicrobiia bacterium]|nr:sigma-70 family RNA polymerase sigma factor [Acidimicrobiia bacterium]
MSLDPGFDSVLKAAQVGAPWAWSSIYREISGPVMGFFRARGASDPESATGDVFFELSRTLPSFEGTKEAFMTLVFAIAYRRLLAEELHPRRRSRSALADRVLDRLQSDIEIVIDDSDSRIPPNVRTAFEALRSEQRDVLSLRIVAGLSVEQTADVLGSSVDSVKSAQRKGLAKLRGVISPPVILS